MFVKVNGYFQLDYSSLDEVVVRRPRHTGGATLGVPTVSAPFLPMNCISKQTSEAVVHSSSSLNDSHSLYLMFYSKGDVPWTGIGQGGQH
jgi:hypothetical protein